MRRAGGRADVRTEESGLPPRTALVLRLPEPCHSRRRGAKRRRARKATLQRVTGLPLFPGARGERLRRLTGPWERPASLPPKPRGTLNPDPGQTACGVDIPASQTEPSTCWRLSGLSKITWLLGGVCPRPADGSSAVSLVVATIRMFPVDLRAC